MDIIPDIRSQIAKAVSSLYDLSLNPHEILVEETSPDHKGDFTVLIFPLIRYIRKAPEVAGKDIGVFLSENYSALKEFEVVKGFLNLTLSDDTWITLMKSWMEEGNVPFQTTTDRQKILIEYSSPNTNKPLHLGHVRNNMLGYSLSEILKLYGHEVTKINLINDRGIHICKSMLAWMQYGNGEEPDSAGIKGDHLIGKYYVLFDKIYKEEINSLVSRGMTPEQAEKEAPSIKQAQELLIRWEHNDPEIMAIWTKLNEWACRGFDQTYKRLGISFDRVEKESEIFQKGKALVAEGIEKGIFSRKEDGSVWVDLTDEGLDEKLLLRADGTSVYITQDLGTADTRFFEYSPDAAIYIVGNEQEYHFQVLKLILKKLGRHYFNQIHHLSYGMIELPTGKMKSREGTVVDADDLMDEMKETALTYLNKSGKVAEMSKKEIDCLSEIIAQGALKFFILKTDIRKNMLFDPEVSIDFQGHTGPFIQYSHARIASLLRKSGLKSLQEIDFPVNITLHEDEKAIIKKMYLFNQALNEAVKNLDPSKIANYVFSLAKLFNHFYHEHPVLQEKDESKRTFRLQLCHLTANEIKRSGALLGIEMPDRM